MYELVYCSLAQPGLSPENISAILKTSIENNAKNNITGCLLYYNQEFVQILEGEHETIRKLFSKIEDDARHSGVILLAEGEKEKRVFSNWSMAYHKLSDKEMERFNREIFRDNFVLFSEWAEKDTFPAILFWSQAALLLKKTN
jgi:hypothetical protein